MDIMGTYISNKVQACILNSISFQGIPGPPSNLKFNEITMNTLKVSWDLPLKPNGEIIGYIVAYETAEQDESKSHLC